MAVCEVCGGSKFKVVGIDEVHVCVTCGAQSRAFSQEVLESFEVISSRTARRTPKKTSTLSLSQTIVTQRVPYLQGIQAILQMQVTALVGRFGCNPRLTEVVWELWSRLYSKYNLYLSDPQLKKSEGFKPLLRYGLLKVDATLALCYLSLLILREPVCAVFLLRMCKKGNLPYFSAYTDLPSHTENLWVFRPVYLTTAKMIERTTFFLKAFLFGRDFELPSVSMHAVAQIVLEDFLLPDLHPLVMSLYYMDGAPPLVPLLYPGRPGACLFEILPYILVAFQICFHLGSDQLHITQFAESQIPLFNKLPSFSQWFFSYLQTEPTLSTSAKPWTTDDLELFGQEGIKSYLYFCDNLFSSSTTAQQYSISSQRCHELLSTMSKTVESHPFSSSVPQRTSFSSQIPSLPQNLINLTKQNPSTKQKEKEDPTTFYSFQKFQMYKKQFPQFHKRMEVVLQLMGDYIGCSPIVVYQGCLFVIKMLLDQLVLT